MAKITLFSKNNCMQCKMTKKFLEKEGADFEEINIDEQPEKIDYVKVLVSLLLQLLKQAIASFQVFNRLNLKKSFNYQVFI